METSTYRNGLGLLLPQDRRGRIAHLHALAEAHPARSQGASLPSKSVPPSTDATAQVVVITHQYGDRCGIRHLPAGLKVYHIPMATLPFSNTAATVPNLFACLPLVRTILIRERIDVVHAHQALSSMGLESLMHARTLEMGIKAVFTDHSLFGLGGGGWGEVTGNKMLKGVLSDVEGVICVSHTGCASLSSPGD